MEVPKRIGARGDRVRAKASARATFLGLVHAYARVVAVGAAAAAKVHEQRLVAARVEPGGRGDVLALAGGVAVEEDDRLARDRRRRGHAPRLERQPVVGRKATRLEGEPHLVGRRPVGRARHCDPQEERRQLVAPAHVLGKLGARGAADEVSHGARVSVGEDVAADGPEEQERAERSRQSPPERARPREPGLGPVALLDLVRDQLLEELGRQAPESRALTFVEGHGVESRPVDHAHPEPRRQDELDREQEDVGQPPEPDVAPDADAAPGQLGRDQVARPRLEVGEVARLVAHLAVEREPALEPEVGLGRDLAQVVEPERAHEGAWIRLALGHRDASLGP